MKRVACIFLSLILLLSVMVGAAPVSAEEGDSLGKLVQLRGQYADVLGASNGIIVCGKMINGELRYGVVDYSGRVLIDFEYTGATAPDEYGYFVLSKTSYSGETTVYWIYNKDCEWAYDTEFNTDNGWEVLSVSEGIAVIRKTNPYTQLNIVHYNYVDLANSTEHFTKFIDVVEDYDGSAYTMASSVSEGYSVICLGNKFVVVGPDGSTSDIQAPDNLVWSYASTVMGGYCVILGYYTDKNNPDQYVETYYLLDVSTLEITPMDADAAMNIGVSTIGNAMVVNVGMTAIVISDDGQVGLTTLPDLQEPTVYYDAISIREGKAENVKYWTIYNNGRWFYIDSDGQTYGDYLDASDFKDHLAAVTEADGLTYVVNESFTQLTQPRDIGASVMAAGDGIFIDSSSDDYYYLYAYSTDPNARRLGDITGDDQSTVSDVVELRNMIMSGSFTDQEKGYCDVDVDGAVTVSDVVELRDLIMAG